MNTAVQSALAEERPIGLSATELDALRANEWFRRLPLHLQRAILKHCSDQGEPRLHNRAGRLLSRLGNRFGDRIRNVTRMTLTMSQSQIAALVGASRQRVNEVIVRLERQGAIRRSPQYMDLTLRSTRSTAP